MKMRVLLHQIGQSKIMYLYGLILIYILSFTMLSLLGKATTTMSVLWESGASFLVYPMQFYFMMVNYIIMAIIINNIYTEAFETNTVTNELLQPISRRGYFTEKFVLAIICLITCNLLFCFGITLAVKLVVPDVGVEQIQLIRHTITYSVYNQIPLFILGIIISCVTQKKVTVYFYHVGIIVLSLLLSGILAGMLEYWFLLPNMMVAILSLGREISPEIANKSIIIVFVYTIITCAGYYYTIEKIDF
ncbi:MAG: hypothetical protein ACRC6X_02925 [Culicoidibacterales bacterium]